MLFEHQGRRPAVDPTASIAPTAVLSGDVRIGPRCRVLYGAVLTAEGGMVGVGTDSIVMENAVLRGTGRHALAVGKNVLVGPHAYLCGCTVEDEVFLATGSAVFNGARIGTRSTVQIRGLVHLRTELPPDSRVPIGWVAAGTPPTIAPPSRYEEIWEALLPLDFPDFVFGVSRSTPGHSTMPELCRRYGRYLARHDSDLRIDGAEDPGGGRPLA